MIVWLWDAPGTTTNTCGVSSDQSAAREAARACVASGTAPAAVIQAATLVSNPDATDPYYARFGPRWQATRTTTGEIRWRELTAPPSAVTPRNFSATSAEPSAPSTTPTDLRTELSQLRPQTGD